MAACSRIVRGNLQLKKLETLKLRLLRSSAFLSHDTQCVYYTLKRENLSEPNLNRFKFEQVLLKKIGR